jgi:sugar/nucleoside kinase (ribokinase family)
MLVCAGGLRVDYLITREGKAHIGLPGGNALFSAAGARLWSDDVALWARYGRNFPQEWLDTLAGSGLDTRGLIELDEDQDHRTFFAYTPQGERDDTQPARHFARIGRPLPGELEDYIHSTPKQDDPYTYEPLALRPADWPTAYGEAALHIAPQPLATQLHVSEALQGTLTPLTVDPGERYMVPRRLPFIRKLMGEIDAFLPSDQEIRSLFGAAMPPWNAAQQLADWGVPVVVIKAGADGVLLLDRRAGKRQHLAAYHQKGDPRVVDVTGAGDAFCGGFLAGLAQTGDSVTACRMGLVSASMVIEGYGALHALSLSRSTARQRLDEIEA